MLPVFAMLANVSGAPLMLTALALLFSNSYGGMVTRYRRARQVRSSLAWVITVSKSWWLVGAVLTILTFLVHITLGVWWWNMLIGWNMLLLNILVILQVACAASGFPRSPQSLT